MKNYLILANCVTLIIGIYFNNDIFIRLSTGGLMNLTLLSYLEVKK